MFLNIPFLIFCQKSDSSNAIFSKIDSVIAEGIKQQAFPGAVLHVLQGDSTLIHKAYGHHTYDSIRVMLRNDIFDLASVTKVSAATLSLMMLYDEGHLDLDAKVSDYVPWLKGNRRGKANIRETLAHQAGWRPWIPYYQDMIKEGEYKKRYFRQDSSENYPVKVKEGLYLTRKNYDFIKKKIKRSDFDEDRGFIYSGLFFYMIPEIVETTTGLKFESYLRQNFYSKVGAETTCFKPTDKFDLSRIVPTEVDTFFRMEPIHGTVHDEGAIVMGGISGNAGLFSNSQDLSKVWKVFLNKGMNDTLQLIEPSTIELFTTAHFPANDNRRGLGFDKPLLEYDSLKSSVAMEVSHRSFGHTGYTGPLVWADPENDLLFIFLCNRVYPTRNQRMIYELGIRPKVQQLVYQLLE